LLLQRQTLQRGETGKSIGLCQDPAEPGQCQCRFTRAFLQYAEAESKFGGIEGAKGIMRDSSECAQGAAGLTKGSPAVSLQETQPVALFGPDSAVEGAFHALDRLLVESPAVEGMGEYAGRSADGVIGCICIDQHLQNAVGFGIAAELGQQPGAKESDLRGEGVFDPS